MLAPDQIAISLTGRHGTVVYPSVERATTESLHALAHVGEALHGVRSRKWSVARSEGDTGRFDLTLAAPPELEGDGPRVVSAFVRGLVSVERDSTSAPRYFTDPALVAMRRALAVYSNGIAALTFTSADGTATPTATARDNIERILTSGRNRYTTLRGRLYRVNVKARSATMVAAIEEQNTGNVVRLNVSRSLIANVRESLDKRVALIGRCQYSANGTPFIMRVESIRVLNPVLHDDIPPLKLTDGEDPADFVRRLRDAQ